MSLKLFARQSDIKPTHAMLVVPTALNADRDAASRACAVLRDLVADLAPRSLVFLLTRACGVTGEPNPSPI